MNDGQSSDQFEFHTYKKSKRLIQSYGFNLASKSMKLLKNGVSALKKVATLSSEIDDFRSTEQVPSIFQNVNNLLIQAENTYQRMLNFFS
jgi:hypothetical protein